MSNFTPGPWTALPNRRTKHDNSAPIAGPDGTIIATASDFNRFDRDKEVEANALLISQSPILFTEFKNLLEYYKLKINQGDTFCEECEVHAHKYTDKAGHWSGRVDPIKHKEGCFIGIGEELISRIEGA